MTTFATNQDLDPERLRETFGVFPSGVVAVAASVDGELVGLAASSFTSVSLEPPLVSVSVARSSRTWPTLRRAPHLGLTVLADDQGSVCRQLAGSDVARRFDGVEVEVTPGGAVLLTDGLATFDTTIFREVDAGDHVVVLLRLHTAASHERRTVAPLVFHRSTFHRLHRAVGE